MFYSYPPYRCDDHDDQEGAARTYTTQVWIVWSELFTLVLIVQFWSRISHFYSESLSWDTKAVIEAMKEEELGNLDESGSLKGQDMAEAFKTLEWKKQCSKHLDRFGLLFFILNCFLLYYIIFCLLGISRGGRYLHHY